MFDHGGGVESVEPTLVARFGGSADYPQPFTLRVRPDVLVRRDDAGTNRDATLEIVEIKTGNTTTVDWLQTVAIRRAVGQAYGKAYNRILSTTSFLSARTARTLDLSPTQPEVVYSWLRLQHLAGAILTETAWYPRPGDYCSACRYFEAGCPLDEGSAHSDIA